MKIFISGLGLFTTSVTDHSQSRKPSPNVKENYLLNELEPSAPIIEIKPLIAAQSSLMHDSDSREDSEDQLSIG